MQHLERHDRNLKIDPLWYRQPVKNCESVGDVVIAAKLETNVFPISQTGNHKTRYSLKHVLNSSRVLLP